MPKEEGVELMSDFFGVELDNDMDEYKKLKGTYITFNWLQEIFHHYLTKTLQFDN
jgi:hypothetical protein